MELLTIRINNLVIYFILAIVGSLAVRIIIAFTAAKRFNLDPKIKAETYDIFCDIVMGVGILKSKERVADDYWLGFVIGLMEIISYPILIKTNKIEIIGAWLVFKTVHRMNYQRRDRGLFNRYLVANGLILIIAYMFARFFTFS